MGHGAGSLRAALLRRDCDPLPHRLRGAIAEASGMFAGRTVRGDEERRARHRVRRTWDEHRDEAAAGIGLNPDAPMRFRDERRRPDAGCLAEAEHA